MYSQTKKYIMNAELNTNTKTGKVLAIMHVFAWIAYIGLCIKVGSILVAYGVTSIYPSASPKLYPGLDFKELREYSFLHYSFYVAFLAVLWGLKVYVLHLVIKILAKVNLQNPFTETVAKLLEQISYVLCTIWIVGVLHNVYFNVMLHASGIAIDEWNTEEFLFMAGVVFIISQIFKRGVELQTENDLTV